MGYARVALGVHFRRQSLERPLLGARGLAVTAALL